jgi:hypothetical protein
VVQEYLEKLKYCTKCECKLDSSVLYYKHLEKEDYFICENCLHYSSKRRNKKLFEKIQPTTVSISKIIENEDYHKLELVDDAEYKELLDEYYKLDYEDCIAGGLKTRFNYVPVEKEDFLLDDDDYIFADDKILNQYLSLKKIVPYKTGVDDLKRKKLKKMLTLVKQSTEKNKQVAAHEIELSREEEHLKVLSKKNPKYKKKLEKFQEKKENVLKSHFYREKQERQEEREQMRVTDMTNAEEQGGPQEADLSSSRLKSYKF